LVAEFAYAGYLRPLRQTEATTGYLPGPARTGWYDGKLWALPFNSDAGLLYYRTDLAPVPPTTLDAMNRQIRGLFDGTTPPSENLVAGYAGQLASYEGLTVNALEAIWAYGGDVVDADGDVVIDSPQTRDALRWLAAASDDANPIILSDSTGFTEADTTNAFRDGKVAFMRNWPVAYRSLKPDGAQEVGGQPPVPFGVRRLLGPSVLGGQDLAVSSRSARPRAAQALIEFLTSERSQQILFERGGFAATREIVYRDSEVRQRYGYAPVLLDAIGAARSRPVTAHYARFSEVFRSIVEYAIAHNGDLRPDAVSALEGALNGY
jgi:multiple sugar transport system substrate-binding protein